MAVKDDRLVRNPAVGILLPRVTAAERMDLSHEQVHELADACGSQRLVALFLAFQGPQKQKKIPCRARDLHK